MILIACYLLFCLISPISIGLAFQFLGGDFIIFWQNYNYFIWTGFTSLGLVLGIGLDAIFNNKNQR